MDTAIALKMRKRTHAGSMACCGAMRYHAHAAPMSTICRSRPGEGESEG